MPSSPDLADAITSPVPASLGPTCRARDPTGSTPERNVRNRLDENSVEAAVVDCLPTQVGASSAHEETNDPQKRALMEAVLYAHAEEEEYIVALRQAGHGKTLLSIWEDLVCHDYADIPDLAFEKVWNFSMACRTVSTELIQQRWARERARVIPRESVQGTNQEAS